MVKAYYFHLFILLTCIIVLALIFTKVLDYTKYYYPIILSPILVFGILISIKNLYNDYKEYRSEKRWKRYREEYIFKKSPKAKLEYGVGLKPVEITGKPSDYNIPSHLPSHVTEEQHDYYLDTLEKKHKEKMKRQPKKI